MHSVAAEPDRQWWCDAVIYEIYVRSFQDGNGDGVGDLAGIRQRLPYVAALGVDAVWLTPFFESPGRDHGYDISGYTAVDPSMGDLAEVDGLLAEAHELGLRVLIDFVPNHTSDLHPWFLDARLARTAQHHSWYLWAEPAQGGGPPNNWLSVFGGPAWTYEPDLSQYYMHSIMPSMPDLNWRDPELEQAMFDVLRFWLDRGVDGVRVDCAHYLMKHPSLPDNPPATPGVLAFHRPMGDYDEQRHVYDKGHPDIHGVYQRLRAVLDGYGSGSRSRVSVGEVHVFDLREWASYYGEQLDELHLPFNFGLLIAPWRADAIAQLIDRIEAAVPPGAWPTWVMGNHDEPRVASRVGPGQARVAMMLLLTLRGTPTIFAGDELGLPSATPLAAGHDPWAMTDPALSRDPARAPMPWTAAAHRGFTGRAAGAWQPTYPSNVSDVAAQTADPASLLTLTRDLLRLRRDSPALRAGSYRPVDALPEPVLGYVRSYADEQVMVLLNLGDRTESVRVARPDRIRLTTGQQPPRIADGAIALGAGEGVIVDVSTTTGPTTELGAATARRIVAAQPEHDRLRSNA
jgi:alpha-glucosidase